MEKHFASFEWDINLTNQLVLFLDLVACVSIMRKHVILSPHSSSEHVPNAGS